MFYFETDVDSNESFYERRAFALNFKINKGKNNDFESYNSILTAYFRSAALSTFFRNKT
jgi:hypothetical protein